MHTTRRQSITHGARISMCPPELHTSLELTHATDTQCIVCRHKAHQQTHSNTSHDTQQKTRHALDLPRTRQHALPQCRICARLPSRSVELPSVVVCPPSPHLCSGFCCIRKHKHRLHTSTTKHNTATHTKQHSNKATHNEATGQSMTQRQQTGRKQAHEEPERGGEVRVCV